MNAVLKDFFCFFQGFAIFGHGIQKPPCIEEKEIDGKYKYFFYYSANSVTNKGKQIGVATPGTVVMPAGNPRSQELLEKNGIKVIPVDISEILKGYGAIHCCTAFLKRG